MPQFLSTATIRFILFPPKFGIASQPRPPGIPAHYSNEALLAEGFTEKEITEGLKIYGPKGCDQCSDGYKGRVGIYQVMPLSDEMGRMIMEGSNAIDLADQAQKEGIPDLRQSGLLKVKNGITSLDELNRVTKE